MQKLKFMRISCDNSDLTMKANSLFLFLNGKTTYLETY